MYSWSLILGLNIVNREWAGSAVHTHTHAQAQLLRATTCPAANSVRQEDFFVVSSQIRDSHIILQHNKRFDYGCLALQQR